MGYEECKFTTTRRKCLQRLPKIIRRCREDVDGTTADMPVSSSCLETYDRLCHGHLAVEAAYVPPFGFNDTLQAGFADRLVTASYYE